MEVTLHRAENDDDLQIVHNMFTAYFYDLSQFDDNLVINTYGLPTWAPSGLPGPRDHDECWRMNWWIRDRCEAYVIHAEEAPAGFLHILRDKRHLVEGVDQELMDFYTAPKFRRQGIGRLAARLAFDMHPGTWQVCELERNIPAKQFWHAVIEEYTAGRFDDMENGTQQKFSIPTS